MKTVIGSLLLLGLAVCSVEGQYKVLMTGCTESYVKMSCAGGDLLSVKDVRVELRNDTHHRCEQQLPPKQVPVPQELAHLCDAKKEHCVWTEQICDHKQECVFYVSPHMYEGKEHPTTDTEVIIEYECKPGGPRKAGFAVLLCVIIIAGMTMIVLGGILVWKDCQKYENFTNEPAAATTPGVTMQTSAPEHISVQLQSPAVTSASNPNNESI